MVHNRSTWFSTFSMTSINSGNALMDTMSVIGEISSQEQDQYFNLELAPADVKPPVVQQLQRSLSRQQTTLRLVFYGDRGFFLETIRYVESTRRIEQSFHTKISFLLFGNNTIQFAFKISFFMISSKSMIIAFSTGPPLFQIIFSRN